MAKKLSLVAGVFAVIGLLAASSAFAATPTLSLTSLGGGSAEINISGDANASVIFYYSVSGSSGMQTTTLGSTDASGAFSTTVNGSSYGISSGASVYVVVDGQQSTVQAWPSSASTSGVPVLSQNSVTLGLGQSVTVVPENNSSVYMLMNSSPTVASVVVRHADHGHGQRARFDSGFDFLVGIS